MSTSEPPGAHVDTPFGPLIGGPGEPSLEADLLLAFQLFTQTFKHLAYRGHQEDVLTAMLRREDIFSIMPTGHGKSVIYQVAACVDQRRNRGTTVVISPINALAREQVMQLRKLGLYPNFVSGATSTTQVTAIIGQIRQGMAPFVLYMSPEYLVNSSAGFDILQALSSTSQLSRLVIDEAHLISQWGRGFRPAYYELRLLRHLYQGIPIACFTATATQACKADVLHILHLSANTTSFTMTFNRPNLHLLVKEKNQQSNKDIVDFIQNSHNEESGIIYCLTRRNCEEVARFLGQHGISATFYHSQATNRTSRQDDWMNGNTKVMVATVAFGLGINKPDVRFVVHYSVPRSIEAYYQEAGRAGRDGKDADIVTYYRDHDRVRMINLLQNQNGVGMVEDDAELSAQEMEIVSIGSLVNRSQVLIKQLDELAARPRQLTIDEQITIFMNVLGYIDNKARCLRSLVLNYFGETFDIMDCFYKCSNCLSSLRGQSTMVDVSWLAKQAIYMIRDSQIRGVPLTLVRAALCMIGSRNNDQILRKDVHLLQGYGLAKGLPELSCRSILTKLLTNQILFNCASGALEILSEPVAALLEAGTLRIMLTAEQAQPAQSYRGGLQEDGSWQATQLSREERGLPALTPRSQPIKGAIRGATNTAVASASRYQPYRSARADRLSSSQAASSSSSHAGPSSQPAPPSTPVSSDLIQSNPSTVPTEDEYGDDGIDWEAVINSGS